LYEIVEIVQHVFAKIFAARKKFFCDALPSTTLFRPIDRAKPIHSRRAQRSIE
jgi:hypothetical protein